MNVDVVFRATLSGVDCENGVCRVAISVGGISVRSYPQSYRNILGDLTLNRQFLEDRTLRTLFFGDEPLVNIDYGSDNEAMVHIGQKMGPRSETLVGSFLIKDGLAELDKVIDDLIVKFSVSDEDIQLIAQQIEDDHNLGVYDIYKN